MALIDYVSQTANAVSVKFAGMPADAEVVFVNQTSNDKTPSPSNALQVGDGTADIPIDPKLKAGQYYLLAQSKTTKDYIAQTVAFFIG